MSVKITELPLLSDLADNDIVAGVDVSGNVTSKIEMGTLKNYIDTNTQYTAGTNIDITNNVVSAPNVYNKDEMDSQIEELQSEVDSLSTIFNAFPTESGEGESLTLDDTAEVKFKKFDLKGNTSQVAYTGKNLIPAIHSFTTSGITWTKNDNGITNISGTTTGGVTVYETSVANTPIKAGTYTFNATVTGTVPANSSQVILQFNDGTQSILNLWSPSARTLTFENDTTIKNYYFYANINMTFNASIAVQLEAGSSATTYEQYIGGKPSPIPDFPQPVNVVSGDNQAIICGKNLFSSSMEIGGISNSSGYNENNNSCIRTTDYILAEPSTQYTINNDKNYNSLIYEYDKNKNFIQYTGNFSSPKTWVTQANTKYLRIRTSAGNVETDLSAKFMLNLGDTSLTYEPYQGNTYNIDLPVENLFDLSNPQTLSSAGITATYDTTKNEITLNGTSSGIGYIAFNINTIASGSIISFGGKVDTPNRNVSIQPANGGNSVGSACTLSSNISKLENETLSNSINRIYITVKNGTTLNNYVIKPSLMLGGTLKGFSPYGTTPIELCKIGNYQDGFGKSDGSNLFDKNLFNPFTSTIQYIDMTLKPNTTYTMSSNLPVTSGVGANLFFMKGGETAATGTNDIRPELTRTLTTDSTGNVRIGYRNAGSIINPITNCNYMLNEGSSALPYQPYGAGRWYKLENVRKLILDNNTSIYKHGSIKSDTKGFYQVQIPYKKTGGSSGATDSALSNYFKLVSGSAQSSFDNNSSGIWWESNSNPAIGYAYFIFEAPTSQEFSNWLGEYTPSLYYQTSTSKVEVITYQPLIDQLNLLEKAMSKEGQTNISQINNDKPFIITAEAIKDLSSVLDRIELLES